MPDTNVALESNKNENTKVEEEPDNKSANVDEKPENYNHSSSDNSSTGSILDYTVTSEMDNDYQN